MHTSFSDSEPLAQWLNTLLKRTEDITAEVLSPSSRHLNKNELLEALELGADDLYVMAHIAARLQFIASNIEVRQSKPTVAFRR